MQSVSENEVCEYKLDSPSDLHVNVVKNYQIKLSLLHINIRSIHNKLEDLKYFICQINQLPEVVVVSETWLKSNEIDYYNLPGYTSYFSCRDEGNGGGVAIYVRSSLAHSLISCRNNGYYSLWIEISNIHSFKKLHIGGYYKPPSYKLKDFLTVLDNDFVKCNNVPAVVLGDFNINECQDNNEYSLYRITYMSHGFNILNAMPTRINNTIDHVLTNISQKRFTVYNIGNTLSDHSAILTTMCDNALINKPRIDRERTVINYAKLPEIFKHKICNLQVDLDENRDVNSNLEKILDKLGESIIESREIKKLSNSTMNMCPWVTPCYTQLTLTRDKLYKKYKRKINNTNIKLQLNEINNRLTMLKRSLIKEYHATLFNECKGDSKKIWRNIRTLLNKTNNYETQVESLVSDGVVLTDPQLITNKFCEHFTNVGLRISEQIISYPNDSIWKLGTQDRATNSIFLLPTDETEIENIINKLNNGKSSGYDNISTRIIKLCKSILLPLLTQNINMVLQTGEFPNVLKIAQITPLHKSGPKNILNNYRPISVLSVMSKIYEKVIHKRLANFYETSTFLYNHQYGFRQNCNTGSAAMSLVQDLQMAIDRNRFAGSIFVDLCKAFDMVDHKILLAKLEMSGIRGIALKLLSSYMDKRIQFVKQGVYKSDKNYVTTGVPQGSVLGPLLFLVYINDIGKLKLHGVPKLFADDTVILYDTTSNMQEMLQYMQNDLTVLNEYLRVNKLVVNIDKTNYIIFTSPRNNHNIINIPLHLNNRQISRTNHVKYLGLYLDENLNWKIHINHIIKKILPVVGILWRLRDTPISIKKLIYNSLVNSHLNYLCMVWGSACKIALSPLQIVQNKAIKAVYNLPRLTESKNMYMSYSVLPIRSMYAYNLLIFIFNNPSWEEPVKHTYHTRQINHKYLTNIKTETGRKSCTFKGYQLFNSLPESIKRAPNISRFKKGLRNLLLKRLIYEDHTLFDI